MTELNTVGDLFKFVRAKTGATNVATRWVSGQFHLKARINGEWRVVAGGPTFKEVIRHVQAFV